MTAQEFAKSMVFLCNAYRQEMNDTQMSVWYNFFRDIPMERFNLAIVRIIEKDRYFPTVSAIRQELALIDNPDLQLDAAEEWEKILDGIQRYGSYRADVAVAEMNPVTAAVVKRIGGFTSICQSDDLEWRRKAFMAAFKDTLERQIQIASYSNAQLTDTERKRRELVSNAVAMLEKKIEKN